MLSQQQEVRARPDRLDRLGDRGHLDLDGYVRERPPDRVDTRR